MVIVSFSHNTLNNAEFKLFEVHVLYFFIIELHDNFKTLVESF